MKQILLYISLTILLSCSSKKTQQELFVAGEDIKNESHRYYSDFAGLLSFQNEMGTHEFQTDNREVVLEVYSQKFGLRNKNTSEILRTEYTYLAFLNNDYLLAEKDSFFGVIDKDGNLIIPCLYNEISFYNIEKPVFTVHKNGKNAILNHNGEILYPFTINYFKSSVTFKNKVFLVTDEENYKQQMLKIADGKIDIIPNVYHFQQINTNLAAFHHDKNGSPYDSFYNMENDSILYGFGMFYYHKSKNEIWATSQKSKYKLYDAIIDSTFTLKPNPLTNIDRIANEYIYQKTERGYQIMDLNDNILPLIYPKIEPYDATIRDDIYGKEYGNFRKHLFKFYINITDNKYGIIDNTGKIIVPANIYDVVTSSDLNNAYSHNINLSDYKKQYLRENKLDKLFYATIYYPDKSGHIKIFKANGIELITIPIEKGDNCYLELSQFSIHGHLMAKCNNKMRIYDLNEKKLVFELNESKGFENFKERAYNGYYYFSYDEPTHTKINYLSNKLKLLYVQEVTKDSVWNKMVKGDKIYFKKNEKIGLIDFDEKEIVPATYDKIDIVHHDFNIVQNDKKYGVISNDNKILIQLAYNKIIYNISNQSLDCYKDDKKEIIYLNQIKLK